MSGTPIQIISVTTQVAISRKSSSILTSYDYEGTPSREGKSGRAEGLRPMAWGGNVEDQCRLNY